MKSGFVYIALACCLTIIAACNQPDQQQAVATAPAVVTPAKPVLPQPFRYHKLIESSPNKYFDVFSWGRGPDSSGAYLILHSDSLGKQYSTTYGDLEGAIIDVYNTDMNMDGNPEILIEAKAKDTTNHVSIYAYEFKGSKAQKLDFPKLSTNTKKGYRGGDVFSIKDGFLVRQFPVYDGNGRDAKPTGKTKILQYGLSDNSFTVKDISPIDSTKVTEKPVVEKTTTEKPKSQEKHTETKKKKKQVEEKHAKKKKHHHSEE